MKKLPFILVIFIFFSLQVYADISLLSPVSGTWSNKQMLVIENAADGDFFYSIDGSDPETFGFAYDGPVLIDVSGDVKLRISHIKTDSSIETTEVIYNVSPDNGLSANYGDFISIFFDTGIINYSAGSVISIPENLYCNIGIETDAYFPGTNLSLSDECVLSRYIPFTVLDPETAEKWRFIVKTFPQSAGIFSRRDVPFIINDWDTLYFTDKNLIYKVDSSYWMLPEDKMVLDRTVSHMISWQNLEYEPGNLIEFFILPPKPELKSRENPDGSIVYYIDGDAAYTISVFDEESRDFNELYREIGADVFYGDKYSAQLELGIFASSVYQGQMQVDFSLNKRPPEVPVIVSNASEFYSRKPVEINISGDSTGKYDLYVAVSDPVLLKDVTNTLNPDNDVFKAVQADNFIRADDKHFNIMLTSDVEGATYYKIRSYNSNDEKQSFISEYSIIIDQFNYYYDEKASSEVADGTAIHPYSDFNSCIEAINEKRNVCLNIKGQFVIPSGTNELNANTTFKTEDDGVILFKSGSTLVLKNSTLDVSNCRIINETNSRYSSTIPLFKLENAVLTLKNCVCAGTFSKNANIFECLNSILNVSESVVSSQGASYASCISAVNSKINLKQSNFTATADTCVIISEHDGTFDSSDNSYKITGKNGRIAELFNVDADISSCQFKAELQRNNVSINPVYKNETTVLREENNVSTGF